MTPRRTPRPTLMTLCGEPQIVIVNQKLVTAHDPADGRILWQHPWPEAFVESPNVAQPLAVGDDRHPAHPRATASAARCGRSPDGDQWLDGRAALEEPAI